MATTKITSKSLSEVKKACLQSADQVAKIDDYQREGEAFAEVIRKFTNELLPKIMKLGLRVNYEYTDQKLGSCTFNAILPNGKKFKILWVLLDTYRRECYGNLHIGTDGTYQEAFERTNSLIEVLGK